MKKLLLFALSMGLGTMAFSQILDTKFSVDSYTQPTGDLVLEDPLNGSQSIHVMVTNNDTGTFPASTAFAFVVSMNGQPIDNHQPGGVQPWTATMFSPLAPGASLELILTQTWGAQTTSGFPDNVELCVELTNVVDVLAGKFYSNIDANKELCADFDADYPASIANVNKTEISSISTREGMMSVFVKNSNNNVQIEIMNITGQVIKSVNTSNTGQDFVELIDVTSLNSGLYIVNVKSENGMSSAQKVFIQ